jgi:lysine biosynthesis protein LysW
MDAATTGCTVKGTNACASCGTPVVIAGRALIGEVVQCGECKAQLEVVDLYPLIVEPAAKVEEDEEDY